ncbi:MAG: 3-phosphoshikimate 1-carboxyvinyltransferase [Actinomycetota bacterium]|nr:3-phosphoshikimate 1-carboxyvinyltransferase [Actinomycetota bacterium]
MTRFISPAHAVAGHIAVPGDKSISHRAVLLAAMGEGETMIRGFGRSRDTEATLAAVRALGVDVSDEDVDVVGVRGVGIRGLRVPREPIDCGNSGTLIRLLAGILAGQEGRFQLTGDESLRARPMQRIAEPLRAMGARVETNDGRPPLAIEGARLRGVAHRLPLASAQVKSCLLLAGLLAEGETAVYEPGRSRDHTERLLEQAGAPIRRRPGVATVEPPRRLELGEVDVPGDFSAAAPFVVAATLLAGSDLTVHGVGVNPTRTGLLDLLERMGARVTVFHRRRLGEEPVADLQAHHAPLVAAEVRPQQVPLLVDELPLFALTAASSRGDSVVRGARELRVKESDRIETVTAALRALGARIVATPDGFHVRGVPARLRGGKVRSDGDHRIAILGAVAGIASREGVRLEGAEAVAISFPGFFELLDRVTRRA